jgi:acetylornithine/succinyldiaminopimelate/putrescine aminotransferase
VDVEETETNFVGIGLEPLGIEFSEARTRIAEQGVLLSFMRPGVMRAATYLGIEDEHVDRAIEAIPRALEVLVGA